MVAIIRRDPEMTLFERYFRPLGLLDEFGAAGKGLFDGGGSVAPGMDWAYGMDVYQQKDDLVIKAEMPGVDKKTLQVGLEDGILTIKAEKKPEEIAEGTTYYMSGRQFGEYHRTIELPFEVDAGKIAATLENGLLEIRLPKAEESKPRHIEVNVK